MPRLHVVTAAGRRMAGLWRDRRGVTALLFTLMTLPAIAFVALAVDAGMAIWARSRLALAADSAALTAVMAGANALLADPGASLIPAQQAGALRFKAQVGGIAGVSIRAVSVALSRSGATVSATATYSGTYRTTFANVFGVGQIALAGHTSTTRTNSPYFDIEIVLDDSSSMAIPSTQSGMTLMGQLVQQSAFYTGEGQSQACAFACHFDAGGNDFYGMARRAGIQLRVDVMQAGARSVLSTIAASPAGGQFQVGVYTFADTLVTVSRTGSNLATAGAAVAAVQIPVTPNTPDTNIPAALASLAALLPASGDGSSAASPRRYVFLVSDGVADYTTAAGSRVLGPISPASCAALKAKGIQVLTLYTTYIPIPTNGFYNDRVAPFIAQVGPDMQACASSPGFAFVGSDPASIQAAMLDMLQAAINSPARVTQ